MTGTVTRVMTDRGFAFLSADCGDVFLHIRDCDPSVPFDDTLKGMVLEFSVEEGPRGKRAKNAKALD